LKIMTLQQEGLDKDRRRLSSFYHLRQILVISRVP
jgi:hypothetical protein